MDAERWERLQALFHAARDMSEEERERYLEAECGADAGLAAEVGAMLAEDERGGSLLDRGVEGAAEALFGPEAADVGPGAAAAPRPDAAPGAAADEEAGITGPGAGQRFGPYRVTGVVGRGGMGVVYLAERPDLGSRVAVKVLRDAALSPARRARFQAEQRTLASLDHPSIARLYDADVLPDGTPWFAMEYVEGVPLTEYCRRRGSSLEARLLLFRAVCEAVQHAHGRLIVHRDLKPSNILVRADGVVKLLDFGIAKQLESLDEPARQTRTGLRLMTPAYAAPEQLAGGPVGIHTDVYALGVILYELLAGRLPFDLAKLTPAEAERVVTGTEPERPSTVARATPPAAATGPAPGRAAWADLDVMCLAAMHKDPRRRYGTVDALIRDIDHFLAGEPLEARSDSLGYRAGKFARRHRRPLALAGVVGVLVLGLVAFYTARLARARDTALAEARRAQRIQRFTLDLFSGGDEEAGPADSLRVVSLLDRGVREAGALDDEPESQADLYATLGGIYEQLGKLDRADSLLEKALAERRALYGPDHPRVGESEVALGRLHLEQARYDDAGRLVETGLARLRGESPPRPAAIADAMVALGTVYEDRGDYAHAIARLREAVDLLDKRGGPAGPVLVAALTELGNSHFYAGHLATADSIFRRVLALDEGLHGPRHPTIADDLINLGAVEHERGDYAAAEGYYRKALGITTAFYGPDNPETASNLTMLGRTLMFEKKLPEARTTLRRAEAIQERVYGPSHPTVASTLNALGSLAFLEDSLAAAERIYARVLAIDRAAYPDGNYVIGVAVANLASVYLARKEYRRAERLFREAVSIYSTTQSPEHLNTGVARIKLGRTLLREGRFAEAARETRAGYDIVSAQADSGSMWLRAARTDMTEEADFLGRSGADANSPAPRTAPSSVNTSDGGSS
jgi:serine/threonine-protein kinase